MPDPPKGTPHPFTEQIVVTAKPPTNAAQTPIPPGSLPKIPVVGFGGPGTTPGGWQIVRSTTNHDNPPPANGHQTSATGEWGTARIDQNGQVSYNENPNGIRDHLPKPEELTGSSSSTHQVGGTSSGVTNPGGQTHTNHGMTQGAARWKHPSATTGEMVETQLDTSSHTEFYDVYKDGVYIATYMVSADATHFHSDGYSWQVTKHNGRPDPRYPGGRSPEIDQWYMSNIKVAALPRGSAIAGDSADTQTQNDEPEDSSADNQSDESDDEQTAATSEQSEQEKLLQPQQASAQTESSEPPVDRLKTPELVTAETTAELRKPGEVTQEQSSQSSGNSTAQSGNSEAIKAEQIAEASARILNPSSADQSQETSAPDTQKTADGDQTDGQGSTSEPESREPALDASQIQAALQSTTNQAAEEKSQANTDNPPPTSEEIAKASAEILNENPTETSQSQEGETQESNQNSDPFRDKAEEATELNKPEDTSEDLLAEQPMDLEDDDNKLPDDIG